MDDFYRHVAEFGESSPEAQQRPPIVKIDLHGPPHGDPSADGEALPHDGGPSVRGMTQQQLAEEQTRSQEQQADEETGAALFQQAIELQRGDLGAVGKMVVD